MLSVLQSANLSLRFVLELCALAALAVWGATVGSGTPFKLTLGVGAPLLAAVVWGLFVAPKAAVPVPDSPRFVIELVVFGAAAVGLAATGHLRLAAAIAIAYVINRALLFAWGQ